MDSRPCWVLLLLLPLAGCSGSPDQESEGKPSVAVLDGVLHLDHAGQAGHALVVFATAECSTTSYSLDGALSVRAVDEAPGDYVAVVPAPIREWDNPVGLVEVRHGPLATNGVVEASVAQGGSLRLRGFVEAVGATVPWHVTGSQILEPVDCGWSVEAYEVPYHSFQTSTDALGEWDLAIPEPGWTHVVWTETESSDELTRVFRAEFPNGFAVGDVTRHESGGYTGPPGRYAGSFVSPAGVAFGSVRESDGVGGNTVRGWTFEVRASQVPAALQVPGYCDGSVCRVFPV